MLNAYIDASERDGGTLCVAGLAFGEARGKHAAREWRKLWGEKRCHMTDLHTRKPGKGIGDWTREQADERMRSMIPIIARHRSFAVAVSCNVSELAELAPTATDPGSTVLHRGLTRAYALCTHMAMHALGKMVGGPPNQISYHFEAGDLHQADSQRFIRAVTAPTAPQLIRDTYFYRSHMIEPKADSRLFEMADILAWEWAKYIETGRGPEKMRGSLRALLDADDEGHASAVDFASNNVRALHLRGEGLERFYGRAKEFGVFSDEPA